MKDQLFLMKPNFFNAGLGPFYCGDSVSVEGFISFFPELRDMIVISYVEFPRPRQALVDAIGQSQQSVPVLILDDDAPDIPGVSTRESNGRRFISDEKSIREYLSIRHSLPRSG